MILSGLFRVYKTFNIFICNLGFRIRGLFWKGLRIDAQPWRPHGKIQMLDLVKNWKKNSLSAGDYGDNILMKKKEMGDIFRDEFRNQFM